MMHEFDFDAVFASLDRFAQGALLTVELSAGAIVLGLAIGVVGAFLKSSGAAWVRALVSAYVEIIRNTPFLVQLYLIYFGLPSAGLKVGANEAALIAMTVNLGAYATEILRAGPEALVMKSGAERTVVYLPGGEVIEAAPFPVEVYNILGAGDAFASGFIYGYLKGWDWRRAARMGNACGAIVVTRHGCANFMPYEQEALDFVEQRGGF